MYTPHFDWPLGILIQDTRSLELRVVILPNGSAAWSVLDGVTDEDDADQAWAQHVASIATPPLTPTERVVSIREFGHAATSREPTAAELPCPRCQVPLLWQCTGIS